MKSRFLLTVISVCVSRNLVAQAQRGKRGTGFFCARVLLLVGALVLVGLAVSARADTIYTNFGVGNAYQSGIGWDVFGPAGTRGLPQSTAMPFTPSGNFQLSQIDLALSFISGTNAVTVTLNSDSNGLPGAVLMTWNLSGLPTFAFGNCCTVQTITPSSPIFLSAGTQYWIVAAPGAADTQAVWNLNSTGTTGSVALNTGSGFVGSRGTLLGAFSVLGTPISCSAPSFADVVQNSVTAHPDPSNPSRILGTFQPNCGQTLDQAAQLGGYKHFNWLQVVTRADVITKYPARALQGGAWYENQLIDGTFDPTPILPTVPFIDPPRFGYGYQVTLCSQDFFHATGSCSYPVQDNLDWYWDEEFDVHYDRLHPTDVEHFSVPISEPTQLQFEDSPSTPCIALGLIGLFKDCLTDKFRTSLVGVKKSDGSGTVICLPRTQFEWTSTGNVVDVPNIFSNVDSSLASGIVTFEGFVPPGSFPPEIVKLYAASGMDFLIPTGLVRPVIIDIKPGEFPNNINPQSHGKIPVAVISTTGFHAPDEVDENSLTFGHAGNEASLAFCHPEDVNGDGLMDLVCHFYTSTAAFQPGDTEGILKGKTLSGTSLFGKDSVRIVPPH